MQKSHATPVPVPDFKITDPFFSACMKLIRDKMLPYQWEALNDRLPDTEPSYSINNFRIAAGLAEGERKGMVFQDSDLYKWLEAVAFSLQTQPNPELEAIADEVIELMEAAQEPDGYLNTYYTANCPDKRWTNLMDNHELYCAGHMIEAAVAYHAATGKDKILKIATRFSDLIDSVFGPEENKLKGYPGHEIIEMALVKLYQVTGEKRYLNLAKYFVDQRGQSPQYFLEECKKDNDRSYMWADSYMKLQYYQAGMPVREQETADGHAVRAVYLYSGMVDVARETGDTELLEACRKLWNNITQKQMYITGAIGATGHGEAFTYDYDLPNDTVYAETCAQIGLCFFAQRLLNIDHNGRYADIIERALYNGLLSGMQLDGTRFFYVNPLEVVPEACEKDHLRRHVKHVRQKWFPCSCCPPNVARMISSLASYACSTTEDTLFIHLYTGGELEVKLNGKQVKLSIESNYPWNGKVSFKTETAGSYTVAIRIPGWCKKYSLTRNDKPVTDSAKDGYVYLSGDWNVGDKVCLDLDMPVTLMRANPKVREDIGKLAVMRGPLVYCLEEVDNGNNLHLISLSQNTAFKVVEKPELLGGVTVLECDGFVRDDKDFSDGELYAAADQPVKKTSRKLTWIPYYAWTNRTPGEMTVWVRED